jgi:ABC-type branched-subunit amino acid transport system substrate-binding protein
LFNTEPPVVRITAAGAALVLLIGVLAAVGYTPDKKGPQGVASRGRTGAGASASGSNASTSSQGATPASGVPSAGGPGGTSVAGGTPTDGGSGPAPGTGVAPDGSPLTASDRGVTATHIKVVFPKADLGPIGQATGLTTTEDENTAIMAYVNDINSSGGINGRLIDPEIVTYDPLNDSEMRADCKDWTESQQVFAVVDSYGWHDDHQLCITQEGHTPLISKWTTVTDWTQRGNPYLWWTGPDSVEVLDNLVASSLDVLLRNKFSVVAGDRESDKLAVGYLKESLRRAGLAPFSIDELSFNAGIATTQSQLLVQKLKQNDVKVVLPVLPFLTLISYLQTEDSQSYYPKLLLSDYESEIQAMLGLAESKYEAALQDTIGPTAFRLGSPEEPKGYTELGLRCSDQFHKQDPNWAHNLEGPGAAMTWCQNIYLFARAATMAGNNLNRDTFNNAMSQIQNFGGAVVPDLTFGSAQHAGPHNYRTVQIHVNGDKQCPKNDQGADQGSCWLIKSDFQPAAHT